jgi:SAM-dependent methyltransferase
MIEINDPEIDIDRIKACIDQEAARYDALEKGNPCPDSDPDPEILPEPPRSRPTRVDKARLLSCQGPAFIHEAYGAILHREPDPAGRQKYLDQLMTGRTTKVEILGRLRYSKEGRSKQVTVKGLLPAFLVHRAYKIPVLGPGLRIMACVVNFPGFMRYIQRLETQVFTRIRELETHLAEARSCIETLTAEVETLGGGVQKNRLDNLALSSRVSDQQAMLLDAQRRTRAFLETRDRPPADHPSDRLSDRPAGAGSEADRVLDPLYLAFENRFRGTMEEIKDKVSVYLPHVASALEKTQKKSVLDVGCGRGEWLGLLEENHITAAGLDMNRAMVEKCRTAGLDVVQADAVSHLQTLASQSLSVITGFHIVEHLPFSDLVSLLDESFRVLEKGGLVIFETPNPENLLVGACDFYYDPTHINPIPPLTLSFLAEARGFVDPQILRLNPVKNFQVQDPLLHPLFTTGRDYAIIGTRP